MSAATVTKLLPSHAGTRVRWNVKSYRGPALYGTIESVDRSGGDFGRVIVAWDGAGRHEYPITLWRLRFDLVDDPGQDRLPFAE